MKDEGGKRKRIFFLAMSEQLRIFIERHLQSIEIGLSRYLPLSRATQATHLNDALRYALFPGGKRWRPMLTLLGAEIVGGQAAQALPAACAMEFLHTSSIILDDLPIMDDAKTRRGRDSLHLVYGESVALLAALALLNESYALLMQAAQENGLCGAGAKLIERAAHCLGSNGMIGGQVVDLVLQGTRHGADALVNRNLKTTALMRLTLIAGATVCGGSEEDALVLADFGESLGMAYQICDDLLDELGAADDLGKPTKQDSRHSRSTFVTELGIEGAHRLASSLIADGKRSLSESFGDRPAVDLLIDAATSILRGGGKLEVAASAEHAGIGS